MEGASWAAAYDRHAARMFDHCWGVLGDDGLAAVALHDAFVAAASRPRPADPDVFGLWLLALARSEALRWTMDRDRALLDLQVRQRLAVEEIAIVLDVSPHHAYELIRKARRRAASVIPELVAIPPRRPPTLLRDRVLDAADGRTPSGRPGFPRSGYQPRRAGAVAIAAALVLVVGIIAVVARPGDSDTVAGPTRPRPPRRRRPRQPPPPRRPPPPSRSRRPRPRRRRRRRASSPPAPRS